MGEPSKGKMHTFFLGNYGFLPMSTITQLIHAFPVSSLQI